MREIFPEAPQACDNTLAIAERCNVEIDLQHASRAALSRRRTARRRRTISPACARKASSRRYGEMTPQIKERLDRELQVIQSKGFSSYFLIVWDFCNYAREQQHSRWGPGAAASARSSAIAWACATWTRCGTTCCSSGSWTRRETRCPISISTCARPAGRRSSTTCGKKYGQVAQIITFGTMKAKAVIRDVCRVLGVPLAEADRLAKLVPFSLDMTLDKALETEPELKQAYDTQRPDPQGDRHRPQARRARPARLGARRRRGHRR